MDSLSMSITRRVIFVLTLFASVFAWHGVSYAEETSAAVSAEVSTVNINSATAEEIADVLSGVGEKKAEDIVSYRKQNGDFKTLSDLGNVKGIGDATLKKNEGRIAF